MSDLDYALLAGIANTGHRALFATVSGAHLYGFASPDSDIDLRGVFILPVPELLRLSPPEETITISMDSEVEIDWVAHDVRKFCRMMTQRNGYVLEQLYSPLVIVGGAWHDELRDLGRGCITSSLIHHYRGFFNTQMHHLSGENPTVKMLLYAYRVLLTGIHVLRTGEVEANLPNLLGLYPVDGVPELIDRKLHGEERGLLDPSELVENVERLEVLRVLMEDAYLSCSLPERATNYTDLDAFVVRVRMETLQGG